MIFFLPSRQPKGIDVVRVLKVMKIIPETISTSPEVSDRGFTGQLSGWTVVGRGLGQPDIDLRGYGNIATHMKTTVDLPDTLLREAKRAALERQTTLRQLVVNGLLRELRDPSQEGPPFAYCQKLVMNYSFEYEYPEIRSYFQA